MSDSVACLFIPKMGIYILQISYKFTEMKALYLTLKSVWAVEMTKYVHWACINIKKEKCLCLIDFRSCRSFVFTIIMKMYSPVLQKVNRKYVFS